MFGLRVPELLLILAVLLLLFGPSKLPQLGETLGKGIRAFRKASDHGVADADGSPAPQAAPEQPRLEAGRTPAAPGAGEVSAPRART